MELVLVLGAGVLGFVGMALMIYAFVGFFSPADAQRELPLSSWVTRIVQGTTSDETDTLVFALIYGSIYGLSGLITLGVAMYYLHFLIALLTAVMALIFLLDELRIWRRRWTIPGPIPFYYH